MGNQEALEAAEEMKVRIEKEHYLLTGRQADAIHARDKDKEFSDFKVDATKNNLEAFQVKLKELKQTAQEAAEDHERQQTTVKHLIQDELEAKKNLMHARDAKNEAIAETKAQRARSAKLANEPLPAPKTGSEDAMNADINKARLDAEHNLE